MNTDEINTDRINYYKKNIGKFSNIDYSTEGYYTKTAKGKLISVTDDGKIIIEGDYKSWEISINKIINSNFLEWREGGGKC